MRFTVLVVDDDVELRHVLRTTLIATGYEVETAGSGEEALAVLDKKQCHVVVLDMNMPGLGGMETCRRIRSVSEAPIIILTVRNAEKDIIETLDAGADDYVPKPFRMPELLARLRSTLRRYYAAYDLGRQRLTLDDVQVDFQSRRVAVRGHDVRLTPKEFEVLHYLANHPNKPIPRREILNAVWGPEYSEHYEYLRAFIKQLRKKIEPEPTSPKYLLTEPWVGYRLNLPE